MTSTLKISALLLLTLGACGSARLGSTTKLGGHVVLDGHYMPAMTEARVLMGEHCGSPFQTIEHGNDVEFRCRSLDSGSEVSAIASNGAGLKF